MNDIIIYGAGGLAKETVQLIDDINSVGEQWNIKGYIDDFKGDCGEYINGFRILGGREVFESIAGETYVVLAIGDPRSKETLYSSLAGLNLKYPVLIHPTAVVAPSARIGEGSIIGVQCVVSVNAVLGRHVLFNTKSFAAHDSIIGDYTSCFVNCIINGGVNVGEGVLVGSNTVIKERTRIGRYAKVSMGSIIVSDVAEGHTVMTRPSGSMIFNAPEIRS